jgi:transcriptional regulator with XRE-family HTH domain
MKKIHEVIQKRRKELKISQKDLAKRLGIKQSFMSKLENGEKPLNQKRLEQLSEILGIDLFAYLDYEDKLFKKWKPIIEMFEEKGITPRDVLWLRDFLNKIMSK